MIFRLCESWENCFPTHYSKCFHDLAQLAHYFLTSMVFNEFTEITMSVFLLKYPVHWHLTKKYCASQFFALGFLNLISERYKKF